jgi:hypothetical protein
MLGWAPSPLDAADLDASSESFDGPLLLDPGRCVHSLVGRFAIRLRERIMRTSACAKKTFRAE